MMNINLVSLALCVAFIYPLIHGFFYKFSSTNSKREVSSVFGDLAFVAALFIGMNLSKKIFIEHDTGFYKEIYALMPITFTNMLQSSNLLFYIIIMPLVIFLTFKLIIFIFLIIFKVTIFPLLDVIEKKIKNRNDGYRRILGSLFQFPRAFAYIIVLAFALNAFTILSSNTIADKYLQDSTLYKVICKQVILPATKSNIAKQLPNVLQNSFKIQTKGTKQANSITYYNGVTLDAGVKSNQIIDNFSKKLTTGDEGSFYKAKKIYNWVGKNIDYDTDKANAILKNDFRQESGAISAFETKKGICFDYACLYVAMCRANAIKVRLITGEGFNGVSWIGHAWNQVYIPAEKKWINVDTTFSKGGNYFNSENFNLDHRNYETAGEW